MFGYKLRFFEQVLVVVNLVLIIGILVVIWLGFGSDLVENCWGKYATEEQAITHCEKQNG